MKPSQAVIVTGASSGIGEGTVGAFAHRGYRVFAGVRRAADGERLEQLSGVRAVHLDVTKASSIEDAASLVQSSGIPLRALINNAGIAVAGPLEHVGLERLRTQLEVNVVGALAATQAFLPMLRQTSGRIVFVGSISGRLPVPYSGAYCASKAAVRALAGALRLELSPAEVGVVLIEPGSVRTPIWQKAMEGVDQLAKGLGAEGVRAYGGVLDALRETTRREASYGMPVEQPVVAIVRAVEAKRPPAEMVIGMRARFGSMVSTLPPRLRDGVLRRSMNLPRNV